LHNKLEKNLINLDTPSANISPASIKSLNMGDPEDNIFLSVYYPNTHIFKHSLDYVMRMVMNRGLFVGERNEKNMVR
jgi:hypothetical protein